MKSKKAPFALSFAVVGLLILGSTSFASMSDENRMMNMMQNTDMSNMMDMMNSPEGQKMMKACDEVMESYEEKIKKSN